MPPTKTGHLSRKNRTKCEKCCIISISQQYASSPGLEGIKTEYICLVFMPE